jgi:putative membrane-bound dehydrogenase-like protein
MIRPVVTCVLILVVAAPVLAQPEPLPPQKAVAAMKVPDGFRVGLVASEPQLVKPIAMTLDDRGRLWVVESHSYPDWIKEAREKKFDKPGRDRILIFEDVKGTGTFDKCTVFWDRGKNLSGIVHGFGGVWLCATPNLLFLPIKPGTDEPAGEPVVVLDGWDVNAGHNVFNTLVWGPDGWLYGCNGIQSNSSVGKPGALASERVKLNCGVWRYHPIKKTFEVVASGTTNPWGLDFDDYGEMFITNCVIKHLFHVVPGAHFVRMYGQDLNAHSYGLLESCADHIHWGGGAWTDSRGGKGVHDEPGGGHAHAGAMIYLGDNWPAEYRNRIFICNIHGNRLNQDILERSGSGYVGRHGKDFLYANDPWFRGLIVIQGPDGGAYVADWCDNGECHSYTRTSNRGRVYRVTYGSPKLAPFDVAKLNDNQLVIQQANRNDWWVRQARRHLQERAAAGKLNKDVTPALRSLLTGKADTPRKLRALWALHVIGALDEAGYLDLMNHPDPSLQVWAVRLALEDRKASPALLKRLTELAQQEAAPAVRLALASGLQRLPLEQRWPVAEGLLAHARSAGDANLPLMIWYGTEPLAAADPERAGGLLLKSRIPLTREYLARRIAGLEGEPMKQGQAKAAGLDLLVRLLDRAEADAQADILRGMQAALQGRRQVAPPTGWAALRKRLVGSASAEVRELSLVLSGVFADQEALATLRQYALDAKEKEHTRRTALRTLIEVKAPDLSGLLRALLKDAALRGPALRGLAAINDSKTPQLILDLYPGLSAAEKVDAVGTLASRPAYALALLEALDGGRVPRGDVSAYTARQIANLNDKQVTAKLNSVWGTVQAGKGDRTKLMAKYKALVTPDLLAKADRSHGRVLFAKNCAACHTLFGAGGKVGPELTGSQRANPEYILTKVLDPNFAVPRDFQVSIITTTEGRVISGIVARETGQTLTVVTQNETINLAKEDVESRKRTATSIMPEGMLAQLSEVEVRDLIAYLAGPNQVPFPTLEN